MLTVPSLRQAGGFTKLAWSIVIVFPASVGWLVFRYAVDVPVEDQWNHLLLLGRYLERDMTLDDWLSSHREHRLLVPRLIWFPVARMTDWNLRVEVAIGFLLVIVTFALLARWTARQGLSRETRWASWVVLSLCLFAWQQWENFLWGAQIQTFCTVLFSVVCLLALAARRLGWGFFGLACLAFSLALYCQATAFVLVPVGVLVLWVRAYREWLQALQRRRVLVFSAIWGALGFFHLLAYRAGQVSESGRLAAAIENPLHWLGYVLVFLGAPIAGYGKALHPFGSIGPGLIAGTLGVALFVWALARSARERGGGSGARLDVGGQRLLLGSLGGFAVGVAVLVGLGRVSEGIGQAYASRYTSYSLLLWLSTLLLFVMMPGQGARRRDQKPASANGRWIALAICVALVAASLGSFPYYRRVHNSLVEERAQLTAGRGPSGLNANQALIEQGVEILKRHRLSAFRRP